jgi:hypothetical protein
VLGVCVDRGGVAGAELHAACAFPVVLEAADLAEFGRVAAVVDQHRERAAGFERGELCPVPNKQHLAFRVGSLGDDPVEGQECRPSRPRR